MARTYPAHPPRDAFAAKLMALYIECGCPRYTLIIEMAGRLKDFYPELEGVKEVTFSKSAISMILHGRRAKLPDPMWVAWFVLCCQKLAVASGHRLTDPGRSTLPGWQASLDKADNDARRLGLPVRHGGSGQAVPVSTGTAVPATPVNEPAALSGRVPPPRHPDADGPQTQGDTVPRTGPIWLSAAGCEHVASFGHAGRALLDQALAQDPHAVYQVAVLLAADQSCDADAISLLTEAAATKHPGALALLQNSPRHLDRSLAATHAGELAKRTKIAGLTTESLAFSECATRIITLAPTSTGPEDLGT